MDPDGQREGTGPPRRGVWLGAPWWALLTPPLLLLGVLVALLIHYA